MIHACPEVEFFTFKNNKQSCRILMFISEFIHFFGMIRIWSGNWWYWYWYFVSHLSWYNAPPQHEYLDMFHTPQAFSPTAKIMIIAQELSSDQGQFDSTKSNIICVENEEREFYELWIHGRSFWTCTWNHFGSTRESLGMIHEAVTWHTMGIAYSKKSEGDAETVAHEKDFLPI